MKDYTVCDKKAGNYIKKFQVTDNKILVETIKKGKFQLEYTAENKEALLRRMEAEAQDIVDHKEEIMKQLDDIRILIFSMFLTAVSCPAIFYSFFAWFVSCTGSMVIAVELVDKITGRHNKK